jgi:t-SNARE complex subunit (syntaxin)
VEAVVEKQVAIRSAHVRQTQARLSLAASRSAAKRPARPAHADDDGRAVLSDRELLKGATAAELQDLAMENEVMLKELQDELDEAELVEREMVEISSLVNTFTEKVRARASSSAHALLCCAVP